MAAASTGSPPRGSCSSSLSCRRHSQASTAHAKAMTNASSARSANPAQTSVTQASTSVTRALKQQAARRTAVQGPEVCRSRMRATRTTTQCAAATMWRASVGCPTRCGGVWQGYVGAVLAGQHAQQQLCLIRNYAASSKCAEPLLCHQHTPCALLCIGCCCHNPAPPSHRNHPGAAVPDACNCGRAWSVLCSRQ